VTLDLNGHTLSGDRGAGHGIYILNDKDNVEIKNGTVRDFMKGIYAPDSDMIRVLGIRVYNSDDTGIELLGGDSCMVRDCIASHNDATGITVEGGIIAGNTANHNSGWSGITAIYSAIYGNTACHNSGDGIGGAHCMADGNTAYGNSSGFNMSFFNSELGVNYAPGP